MPFGRAQVSNRPYVQFLIIFSNFDPALAAVIVSQVTTNKTGVHLLKD